MSNTVRIVRIHRLWMYNPFFWYWNLGSGEGCYISTRIVGFLAYFKFFYKLYEKKYKFYLYSIHNRNLYSLYSLLIPCQAKKLSDLNKVVIFLYELYWVLFSVADYNHQGLNHIYLKCICHMVSMHYHMLASIIIIDYD